MKTISYEISEQLSGILGPRSKNLATGNASKPHWRAPDWYFQSVSGGIGPLGVQKGFIELQKMGICDHVPAMANIQVEGCAPMVHAWRRGLEIAEPVLSPQTHIATLATGDPGRTYTLIYQRMQETGGGCFESVSDDEAYRAMHVLGKMEGISVEPAAAVAFAGLIKLARSGVIRPDEVIVVNCSGHTMPVEKSAILGLPLSLEMTTQPVPETPEEGLLAALNRMTSDRFPRIEIVDDHPDARRLIRRILQSQGNYTFFEVDNGAEAIQVAQRELPDLIILDLMMPEYDGFSVLDALKEKPETSPIPVIVVTAKDLSPQEKKRLEGRIFALKQKGEFMSDELMDEIRMLLS